MTPIYSYEFERDARMIQLRQGNRVIDQGTYQDLKTRYPLVYFVVLYLWLPEQNEVVRFPIKGSSLSEWFDYERGFAWNEAITDYATMFTTSQEKKGSITYYQLHFVRGEQTDGNRMLAEGMKLHEWLKQYEMIRDAQLVPVTPAAVPESYDDTELNIEDIPFS